jgi:multiple sugar transport system substrate-binding protein
MRQARRGATARGARRVTFIAATGVVTALLAGCMGGGSGGDVGTSAHPVTITFWHGYNLAQDVKQIGSIIADFESKHPNIRVKATPNVSDDKLLQGLRGANSPDVVSSFTTNNVGAMCQGALIDLNPLLDKSKVDRNLFVKARLDYTQYKGRQCTLPLLGDAFGLYYNTDMFAAAGISAPPKTWSEFTRDAVKLTKSSGESYQSLGFMPSFRGYETTASTMLLQYQPRWHAADGKSALAGDPSVAKFFADMKSMQSALGGYSRLEKYRLGFGDEWSAQNAFEVGKVAMQLDGEWRAPLIASDGSKVKFATAPLPVPDDRVDAYGMGPITGTVIGIASKSKQQAAAWELVKYLTTDTSALVSFANEIRNLPTTIPSMNSPQLVDDPAFKSFVKIAGNKYSAAAPTTANGGNYLTLFDDFAAKWQAGKIPELQAGLKALDAQIDAANAQSR